VGFCGYEQVGSSVSESLKTGGLLLYQDRAFRVLLLFAGAGLARSYNQFSFSETEDMTAQQASVLSP
jgi:hypothetical protein